jgi:hypothetical protein
MLDSSQIAFMPAIPAVSGDRRCCNSWPLAVHPMDFVVPIAYAGVIYNQRLTEKEAIRGIIRK